MSPFPPPINITFLPDQIFPPGGSAERGDTRATRGCEAAARRERGCAMALGAAAAAQQAKPSAGGSAEEGRGSFGGAPPGMPSGGGRGSVALRQARGTPRLGRAPGAGTAARGAALSLSCPVPGTAPLPTSAPSGTGAATTSSRLTLALRPSGAIGLITAPTARIWGLPGRPPATGCSSAHTEPPSLRQSPLAANSGGAAGSAVPPVPQCRSSQDGSGTHRPESCPRGASPQQRPEQPAVARQAQGASQRGAVPVLGHAQLTEFAHRGAQRRLTPSQPPPPAHARSRLLICYRLSHSVRKMSTAF